MSCTSFSDEKFSETREGRPRTTKISVIIRETLLTTMLASVHTGAPRDATLELVKVSRKIFFLLLDMRDRCVCVHGE